MAMKMDMEDWACDFVQAVQTAPAPGNAIGPISILLKDFRAEVLKEAAERAVEWNEYHCGKMLDDGASLRAAILGDHVPGAEEPLPLDRLMNQLVSACRDKDSHNMIRPFVDKAYEILHRGDQVRGSTKMIDLDPVVQDAVQKNIHTLTCPTCAESTGCSGCAFFATPERKCYDCSRAFPQDKNRQDLYKSKEPCPTCAESVDGEPNDNSQESTNGYKDSEFFIVNRNRPNYVAASNVYKQEDTSCPTCAESVDGAPGGACCGQCREEREHLG